MPSLFQPGLSRQPGARQYTAGMTRKGSMAFAVLAGADEEEAEPEAGPEAKAEAEAGAGARLGADEEERT